MKTPKKSALLLLTLLLINCSTTYKLTHKAEKHEKQNNYRAAADLYFNVLEIDRNHQKGKEGLKKNGNIVINNIYYDFKYFNRRGKYKKSYDKYFEIHDYYNKVKKVGIKLNIPNELETLQNENRRKLAEKEYKSGQLKFDLQLWESALDHFTKVKNYLSNYKKTNQYIQDCNNSLAKAHYKQGQIYYNSSQWSKAISEFKSVKKYISNYKNTNSLLNNAIDYKNLNIAKNYYTKGLNYKKQKKYKTAYNEFNNCLKYVSGYKDAQKQKKDCLEKGKIHICILPFQNYTNSYNAEKTLHNFVLSEALSYRSMWIDIVDRNQLNRIISEIQLGMTGLINENTISQSGKIVGIDYFIIGDLVKIDYYKTGLKRDSKKAWEKYKEKDSNIIKGRKVYYYECENSCELNYEFNFKVINTETALISESKLIRDNFRDYVYYSEYDGDPKQLVDRDPSPIYEENDSKNPNFAAKVAAYDFVSQITARFEHIDTSPFYNRKELKSKDALVNESIESFSYEITRELHRFLDDVGESID